MSSAEKYCMYHLEKILQYDKCKENTHFSQ